MDHPKYNYVEKHNGFTHIHKELIMSNHDIT